MTVQHRDAKSLFLEAVENRLPAEWRQFLDENCGDDAALRQRVVCLLRAHAGHDSLFDDEPLVPTIVHVAEVLGTIIGPYKLREVLGEGGMGIVYAAEQEQPIRRKVALKLIKPGMDSREVISRFHAERQVLALMDHPHIAKVIDAGTTDSGGPYFVMELVRGMPITEYCDQARLSLPQRLKLFITVCQAIQHAHQKGIIHRDLKPSNVMITLHDGTPVPKVIDFGVAKALNQRLTEQTLYTKVNSLVGTPTYMSPEQAELSGLDIDTRSDVYSLGVLLYELLTGRTPFDKEQLSKVGFDEFRRIIREDEPPRPSHRVSTLGMAVVSTVSSRRGIDERHLAKSLRGELDWIAMKALEKDRTRRYGSADALAADLQAYLNDQPVQACPPSWTYRLQKFIRRQRVAISGAALAVALGMILAAVIVFIRDRAGKEFASVAVPDGGTVTITDDPKPTEATPTPKLPPRASAPGRYLPGLIPEPTLIPAIGRWQVTTVAPRGFMKGVAWSPDGKRIAFGEAGNIRICEAESFRLLHALVGHTRPVSCIAWNPDGSIIASSSWDGTVRLWSADGIPLYQLQGHAGRVHAVSWSPDGKQLVSAGLDCTIRLWGADGTVGAVIRGHTQSVNCVAWSPDGQWIASSSGEIYAPDGTDHTVRLWKTDGTPERVFSGHESPVHWVAWSPDSRRLASCSGERRTYDGQIRCWNIDGLACAVLNREGPLYAVSWSPDGESIAATSGSGQITLSDLMGAKVTQLSVSHYDLDAELGFHSVAWSPDGQRLAAVSSRSVGTWRADGTSENPLQTAVGVFVGVDWHPEGDRIASGGSQLRSWAADGTECSLLSPHYAHYLDWSPDGQTLAWTDITDGKVQLTRADGTLKTSLNTSSATVSWSPDGVRLASATGNNLMRLSSADATGKLDLKGHTDSIRFIAWSPDGRQLVSVSWGEKDNVRIWGSDGSAGTILKGHTIGVNGVAWSGDGEYLATAGFDGTTRLWKKDGTAGPILDHHSWVYPVSWSPDGRWLATGTADGLLRLWKTSLTYEQGMVSDHTIHVHQGLVHSASWSPDSTRIVTASFDDSTIRVWNHVTQTTEWIGLLLSNGGAATFADDGSLLSTNHSDVEHELLYLREQPSGAVEILPPQAFEQRYGVMFRKHETDRVGHLIHAGEIDAAAKLVSRIEATYPNCSSIWDSGIGDTFFNRGMFTPAVIVYTASITRSPSHHCFKRRGAAYMALRKFEEALADITTAVELNPDDASNFTSFPQSLLWESPPEIQDAFLDLATKAIDMSPTNYPVRASYYLHRGDYRDALADRAAAVEHSADNAKLCNNVAWMLATCESLECRDAVQAVQLAERAVTLDPNSKSAWNTLGVARYRNADWLGALDAMQTSMELNSGSDSYDWFFLAMTHWQLGHNTESLQWFKKAVNWMETNKPQNDELLRFRAEAAELLGIPTSAETPADALPNAPVNTLPNGFKATK